MSETEYGVRAPKLDDGSLLLQERVLTHQQTEMVKTDRESFLSDEKAAVRDRYSYRFTNIGCLVVLSVNLIVTMLSLFSVIRLPQGATGGMTVALIAVFTPFWLRNWLDSQSRQRMNKQSLMLNGEGALVPLGMVDRFVSDREQQRRIYVELLTKGSAPIASSGSAFRITLDDTNQSKFVMRVVQTQNV